MGTSSRKWLMVVGTAVLAPLMGPAMTSPAGAAPKGAKVAADGRPRGFNARTTETHLRTHQRYPATRAEILAECDNLSDFTDADRRWLASKLPDRRYQSPDEVLEVIGLKAPPGR